MTSQLDDDNIHLDVALSLAIQSNKPESLLRMMTPGLEFRGDTQSGISWCHPLPCNASAAVTDLSKNYVQMQMMETKKKFLAVN